MNIFFIILSLCLTLPALAVRIDGRYPADPAGEATAAKRIRELDPLQDKKLRKDLGPATFNKVKYNAIRLEGGLQLHPSCVLEASKMNIDPVTLKKRMDELMRRMMDRMASCTENYPEMKSYVQEAISQYRRQYFKCEPLSGQKGMVTPMGTDYWAYNDGDTIVVAHSMFSALVGTSFSEAHKEKAMASIFHEILHSTHSNNRHDHNQVEVKGSKLNSRKVTCDDNVTMDRVNVIESLCMGARLSSSDSDAAQLLADRMNMCGNDRGCRQTFTEKGNNFNEEWPWLEIPNRDLNDANAVKLCQRIKDDGMCLNFRKTQGETITKTNIKVQQAKAKMLKHLNQLLPGTTNVIPLNLLALYPELKKHYEGLKDNSCFTAHFFKRSDSIHLMRTSAATIQRKDWNDKTSLMQHLSSISDNATYLMNKFGPSPECVETNKEIKTFLNEFWIKVKNSNSLNKLSDLYKSAFNGSYPEDESFRDENSEISQFIGKDVLRDYVRTLDQLHYKSPHFDCVAAGLAPFRALEEANRDPTCNE